MASAHSCSITNLTQLCFEGLGTHKVDICRLCASRGFPLELAHVEGIVETFRRHQFFVGGILFDLTTIEHHDFC